MKYTAISIMMLFFFGLATAQASDNPVAMSAKEDVEALKSTFNANTSSDCYQLTLGEQVVKGSTEVSSADLQAALGGPITIVATGSCAGVSSIESIRMEISYHSGTDVEYPVDQLEEIQSMPAIGERLLYNAKEVRFVGISIKDVNGELHTVADQKFILRD